MASYSINLVDNGSGVFTATAFRAPSTAASGGTALLGGGSNLLSTSTNTTLGTVIEVAKLVCENDRSANG